MKSVTRPSLTHLHTPEFYLWRLKLNNNWRHVPSRFAGHKCSELESRTTQPSLSVSSWRVWWRAGRMSAGTIVITGGILAGVILLCIVAVLCYCRLQVSVSKQWIISWVVPASTCTVCLQYYCCRKNGSEVDVGSVVGADPLSHFPCNACNALAMDGTAITPVSLDQLDAGAHHNHCPTCSPYPVRSGLTDDMRNGGERLGFHTYYENRSVSLPLCADPPGSSPLSYYGPTDMFPPPHRSYSTQVWPAARQRHIQVMDYSTIHTTTTFYSTCGAADSTSPCFCGGCDTSEVSMTV